MHPLIQHYRKCSRGRFVHSHENASATCLLSCLISALGGGFCLHDKSRLPLIYSIYSMTDGKPVGAEERICKRADQTQVVYFDRLQSGLPQVSDGAKLSFSMNGHRWRRGRLLPDWNLLVCGKVWAIMSYYVVCCKNKIHTEWFGSKI